GYDTESRARTRAGRDSPARGAFAMCLSPLVPSLSLAGASFRCESFAGALRPGGDRTAAGPPRDFQDFHQQATTPDPAAEGRGTHPRPDRATAGPDRAASRARLESAPHALRSVVG